MKKQLLHWAYLLVAGLALGACGGDDAEDTPTPPTPSTPSTPTGKWSVTIKAGVDETRGLSLSGTTLSVNWSTNETVYAYYGGQKVGELHPTGDSAGSDVMLQGNLNAANYVVGQSLTLKFPREAKDYTGQAGTIADIAAKYDYLEATTNITLVDASNHTLTVNSASFTSQQAIARLTFNADLAANDVITITGAAGDAAVSVTLASAVTAGDPVYVALPLTGSGTPYTLGFTVARSSNTAYTGSLADKTLQNNKYYGASVKLSASKFQYATLADIGRVIGADGKLYDNATSATNASTQAVAVIAYVGAAGSAETGTNYRGLAIAMQDCGSSISWCSQHSNKCKPTDHSANNATSANAYKDGISITNTLADATEHNHYAAKAARDYNVARPTGCSGWFLPSIGQWQLMNPSTINTILNTAGANQLVLWYNNDQNYYWSSTQSSNVDLAWRIRFNDGGTNTGDKMNTTKHHVRAVFAF